MTKKKKAPGIIYKGKGFRKKVGGDKRKQEEPEEEEDEYE